MNIALDIDNVLRDSLTPLIEKFDREFPQLASQRKPITAWDLAQFFPIGKEIYRLWFNEWCKECFEDGWIYDGAVNFVDELKERGHYIVLVTSQPKGCEKYTLNWIEKSGLKYDAFGFFGRKSLTACDIYLDDGAHNLEELATAGRRAVCFDQPWNQDWKGERVVGRTEQEKYWQFQGLL